MKKLLLTALMTLIAVASVQAQQNRILANDPAAYRELGAVHAGAGKMGFTQLIGRTELGTEFLYLHAGRIEGKSGIGHHFHHSIEEMFVILDGEAEFTVNGRTSTIKAPAVVPCKMGDSHAIYNPSDKPLSWLNFAVSKTKGKTDAFDLGDTRQGAALDPVPTFVNGRLEKEKLRPNSPVYAGQEVQHRRVFGPEVFQTNWHHVDHLLIPAGKSGISRKLEGFEEVYYVTKGSGNLATASGTGKFKANDAFYATLGESITLTNTGTEDLEILVIGIAVSKANPVATKDAMALQMDFVVPAENAKAFEDMYHSIYVPAMLVQPGYQGSKLLKLFSDEVAKQIQAEPTTYNYQIQISFDTEENRRKWVASKQHDIAWPAASGLAKEFKWRGYEIKGSDDGR
jgi:mannose-6-phosphate isomerase-like protein (cupin superfamily)